MSRALQILLALVATRSTEAALDLPQQQPVEDSTAGAPAEELKTQAAESLPVAAPDDLGSCTRSRVASL